MKRPWKVITHVIRDGQVVESVASYGKFQSAVDTFEVAVLFDRTARLEYRGT